MGRGLYSGAGPWLARAIGGSKKPGLAAVAPSDHCVSLERNAAAALSRETLSSWRRSVGAPAFHGRLEPVLLDRERKQTQEVALSLLAIDPDDHAGVGSVYVA